MSTTETAGARTDPTKQGTLLSINEVCHAPARLGVMTLLATEGECDFSFLKARLGLTDGNLGAHIRVLEDAGYLEITKTFADRRPRTTCRFRPAGRRAFKAYLEELESVIRMARG